ncbi:hypothetical protein ACS0TY_024582 [Phlomoides rotata]
MSRGGASSYFSRSILVVGVVLSASGMGNYPPMFSWSDVFGQFHIADSLQFLIYPIPSPIAQSLKSYFAATSGDVEQVVLCVLDYGKQVYSGYMVAPIKFRGVKLTSISQSISYTFLYAKALGSLGEAQSTEELPCTNVVVGKKECANSLRKPSINTFDENTSALGSAEDELAHLYEVTSFEAAHRVSIRRSKSMRMTKNCEVLCSGVVMTWTVPYVLCSSE